MPKTFNPADNLPANPSLPEAVRQARSLASRRAHAALRSAIQIKDLLKAGARGDMRATLENSLIAEQEEIASATADYAATGSTLRLASEAAMRRRMVKQEKKKAMGLRAGSALDDWS